MLEVVRLENYSLVASSYIFFFYESFLVFMWIKAHIKDRIKYIYMYIADDTDNERWKSENFPLLP